MQQGTRCSELRADLQMLIMSKSRGSPTSTRVGPRFETIISSMGRIQS